jgi:hypothetical protein
MDLTEGSETSAQLNLTPGKYAKENIQERGRTRIPVVSKIDGQRFKTKKTEIRNSASKQSCVVL